METISYLEFVQRIKLEEKKFDNCRDSIYEFLDGLLETNLTPSNRELVKDIKKFVEETFIDNMFNAS